MANVSVFDQNKSEVGKIELSKNFVSEKINYPLVHQVIKAYLAGRRAGNAKVKTKAEIRGGGRKPFKQKGTGNARRGSSRSPLIVGGGRIHGPLPRSYDERTPRKMVAGALRSAFLDRVNSGRFIVMDSLELKEGKTKALDKILRDKFKIDRAVVVDDNNRKLELAGRNLAGIQVTRPDQLQVYDIIRSPWLVMSKRAVEVLEKRLAKS